MHLQQARCTWPKTAAERRFNNCHNLLQPQQEQQPASRLMVTIVWQWHASCNRNAYNNNNSNGSRSTRISCMCHGVQSCVRTGVWVTSKTNKIASNKLHATWAQECVCMCVCESVLNVACCMLRSGMLALINLMYNYSCCARVFS